MGARDGRVTVIVATNVRFGDWNSLFGNERMTLALLDRLTHIEFQSPKGHILEFIGESYRFCQCMHIGEQATATETG